MRTFALAAAFAAGAVLAGCSKPEPAAGAPSPDVVTVDSSKTTTDSAGVTVKDSMTTMTDSTMTKDSAMTKDTAMSTRNDSATTVAPDSATKP